MLLAELAIHDMAMSRDVTPKPEMDTHLRVDIYKFFGATQFLGRNVLVLKERMIANLQDAENERRNAAKNESENKRVLEELRKKIRELEHMAMSDKGTVMRNADDKDDAAGGQAKASALPSTPAPSAPTNAPTVAGASSTEGKKKKKRDTE
ncbi:unnamed protein product [Cylicostephanus goldi]|uniref:Uncharacterized protein n=1 Tax=Cylicostephanus goldi TaxID=71465 RepID=A0A3P6Q5Q0_CYLGO|nr:unnamed protein product [Cylicostephanus goldi]